MNCFINKRKIKGEKMLLPNEIWVMGHKWDIEPADDNWFNDTDSWGDCCSQKRRIRVYCGGGGSITRDTLLHEILHACWHILAFREKEEEERVVNSLSSLLIGIIDDPRNEDVINFLMDKGYDNSETED